MTPEWTYSLGEIETDDWDWEDEEDNVIGEDEEMCDSDYDELAQIYRTAAQLELISLPDAASVVAAHHYSHLMPVHTKIALGLFSINKGRGTKELEGAITFGWGVRPRHTIQKIFPSLNTCDYFELGKLCVSDELPRSTESRFICAALGKLHQSHPQIKLVFTWADGLRGKPGYVYQGSNFLYGGFIWTDVYRNRNGLRIHPRQLHHRPSLAEMNKFGIEQFFGKQFRYVYFLCGTRERKRLLAESARVNFQWTRMSARHPKQEDLQWLKRTADGRVECEQPIFTGTYERSKWTPA